MDFVRYDCPEGFIFNNTLKISLFAICHDWKFHLMFDPATACIPVLCPCPRWFANSSWTGSYNWNNFPGPPYCTDNDKDRRGYKAEVEYKCPTGFIFDNYGLDEISNDTDTMTLTCAKWSGWEPYVEPKCKRKCSLIIGMTHVIDFIL